MNRIKLIFKLILIFASVFLLNLTLSGQRPRGFFHDYDSALEAAGDNGQVIMASFYTNLCLYNKKLEQEIYRSKEFIPFTDDFACVKINIKSEEGQSLSRKYNVSNCPTLLFMSVDGIEIERITTYIPKKYFIEELYRISDGNTIPVLEQRFHQSQEYLDVYSLVMYHCRNNYNYEKLERYFKTFKTLDSDFEKDSTHILVRYVLEKELYHGMVSAIPEIEKYVYSFPDNNSYHLAILLSDYYLKDGYPEKAWDFFSDFYLHTNQKNQIQNYYIQLKERIGKNIP